MIDPFEPIGFTPARTSAGGIGDSSSDRVELGGDVEALVTDEVELSRWDDDFGAARLDEPSSARPRPPRYLPTPINASTTTSPLEVP